MRCKYCNRPLKSEKSIQDGCGPSCKKKLESGKAIQKITLDEFELW